MDARVFERHVEFRLRRDGFEIAGRYQAPVRSDAEAEARLGAKKVYEYAGPGGEGETRFVAYVTGQRFRLLCFAYKPHLCEAHREIIDLAAAVWGINASRKTRGRKRVRRQDFFLGRHAMASDTRDVKMRANLWKRLEARVENLPFDCSAYAARWWPGGRDGPAKVLSPRDPTLLSVIYQPEPATPPSVPAFDEEAFRLPSAPRQEPPRRIVVGSDGRACLEDAETTYSNDEEWVALRRASLARWREAGHGGGE